MTDQSFYNAQFRVRRCGYVKIKRLFKKALDYHGYHWMSGPAPTGVWMGPTGWISCAWPHDAETGMVQASARGDITLHLEDELVFLIFHRLLRTCGAEEMNRPMLGMNSSGHPLACERGNTLNVDHCHCPCKGRLHGVRYHEYMALTNRDLNDEADATIMEIGTNWRPSDFHNVPDMHKLKEVETCQTQ